MQVKINGNTYPAIVLGKMSDADWDGRHSKTIRLKMNYATANALFVDGASWSIVDGADEFDNSDFNIAGDITDHRDGMLSVKMGKPTDLEGILELLYGGDL